MQVRLAACLRDLRIRAGTAPIDCTSALKTGIDDTYVSGCGKGAMLFPACAVNITAFFSAVGYPDLKEEYIAINPLGLNASATFKYPPTVGLCRGNLNEASCNSTCYTDPGTLDGPITGAIYDAVQPVPCKGAD